MADPVVIFTKTAAMTFVVTSVLSAGLGVLPREVVAQVTKWRFTVLSLLMNFGLAPLVAYGVMKMIPMKPGHATGLLLLGVAAGAPFLPKLAAAAKGDLAFSVAMMIVLLVATVGVLPLAMPMIKPGWNQSPWDVVLPLLILVALPLMVGMAARVWLPSFSKAAAGVLKRVSDISMLAFFGIVVVTQFDAFRSVVGTGAILAVIVFTLVVGVVTYMVCRVEGGVRRVLAVGTAQRNVAAALVTASGSFAAEKDVQVMVLVATIVGVIVVYLLAWFLKRVALISAVIG